MPLLASRRATTHCTKDSYTEHVFKISCCPDLLVMMVNYRTCVLKISEEDGLDTKLSSISSAKENKDTIWQPSEEEIIKVAPQQRRPEQRVGRGGRLDLPTHSGRS